MAGQTLVIANTTPMVNFAEIDRLDLDLHLGEAECLALALEQATELLLLLDELAARQVARHHQFRFTGTVGCLILAKEQNLVPAVAPLLKELQTKARFWLSTEFVETVLRDVDELAS